MPSNRNLTLINLVCASCVLHLDIINLFLQHVHPPPPWANRDYFLYFDAPLVICAFYFVLLLNLYAFAHKSKWQVGVAIFFEIIHFGVSIWDASHFFCLYHHHQPGYPTVCVHLQSFIVSLFNIFLLTGGLVSQGTSLYRQSCKAKEPHEVYENS